MTETKKSRTQKKKIINSTLNIDQPNKHITLSIISCNSMILTDMHDCDSILHKTCHQYQIIFPWSYETVANNNYLVTFSSFDTIRLRIIEKDDRN